MDQESAVPMLTPPSVFPGAQSIPTTIAQPALIVVRDRARWNDAVQAMPQTFVTQTWEWGELYESRGWEAHRLAWVADGSRDRPLGAIQILVRRLPVTGWGIGYAARGPLQMPEFDIAPSLAAAMGSWGRANRVATLVVDPAVDADASLARVFAMRGWSRAPALGQDRVHVMDLTGAEDLWRRLRPKHRQWIRRAERGGVQVAWTDDAASSLEADAAFADLDQVYAQVAERLRLPYKRDLLRAVWTTFRTAGRAKIVTARHGDRPVAALLLLIAGEEMVGFAGGQADDGMLLGAGKLVQWRAIQRAQELGLRRYNMWGTSTPSLAHYKEGFGAREECYVGTWALAISPVQDRILRLAWIAQRLLQRSGHMVRTMRRRRPFVTREAAARAILEA